MGLRYTPSSVLLHSKHFNVIQRRVGLRSS